MRLSAAPPGQGRDADMNAYLKRWMDLLIGTVLYALGIVVTMKANIGYAPWELFHAGLGKTLGISVGNASIMVSVAICAIDLLLKEKLGIGTVLNMALIGALIDVFMKMGLLPAAGGLVPGLLQMLLGLFIVAFGVYFYVKAALGAGPRDSLMIALERKTRLPVGVCRAAIEAAAVAAGWLLGGPVGFGTLFAAAGIGFCVQTVFALTKFRATSVSNETLDETFGRLRKLRSGA